MQKILVWDWPVRIGHWLMAAGFALAWLTAESESLRLVHVLAGATVVAIAAFRLLWGLVGTRHARFADFVHGPRAVAAYLAGSEQVEPTLVDAYFQIALRDAEVGMLYSALNRLRVDLGDRDFNSRVRMRFQDRQVRLRAERDALNSPQIPAFP